MSCLLVPAAEAVVTTVISKAQKSKEKKMGTFKGNNSLEMENKIPFLRKLKWLTNMLWGGSALLAFEHIWHGEIVPWFPFLTAASDSTQRTLMFSELVTVGVSMSIFVTAVWGVMLLITNKMEKKTQKAQFAAK